ncbi:MAG: hypothetical protein MJ200_03795 [Mycoplasmoidaceae bacterium]|nr:hypothetical protein [Mycoplasmoidaceae bacterium]
MPRGTTVYMDDEGIVQGFMPNCSTELIEAELLGYQEYDHKCLRMPKGAKGIADHAFEN